MERVPEEAIEAVAANLSSGYRSRATREKDLKTLRGIFENTDTADNARVQAAALIAKIEGFEDMAPEEDEEEGEERTVARFQKAIQRKKDLEEEFRKALRDPATLARVERLCAEVRATL